MSDTVNSVFLEKDDEEYAPPERLLKVGFVGGFDHAGDSVGGIVFFKIGTCTENTYSFGFESSAEQSFSVKLDDLLRALIALGAIDLDSATLDD